MPYPRKDKRGSYYIIYGLPFWDQVEEECIYEIKYLSGDDEINKCFKTGSEIEFDNRFARQRADWARED